MKIKYLFLFFCVLISTGSVLHAQGDLDDGIYWGYQGWHLAPNDGRIVSPTQWYHWFDDVNTGNTFGVDMYPDMSEYQVQYPTNFKYPDGSTATLYSAFDYETVDLHVKWMKEYGIKGLFLQRQNANITSAFQLEFRDTVTMHVIKACEKYSVKFCMMPCNNDKNTGGQQMIDKVINDWKHCVDDLNVLESPMYMYQNGKPVIGFWGLGFDNRPMLASEAHVILDFFQNKNGTSAEYEVYVMGGVPSSWRTNPKEGGWDEVFLRLDMISPWRTLFATEADGVSIKSNTITTMQADIDYCLKNNVDYAPVISPGASTATQHDKLDSFNWRKRSGGQFIWNQVYEICRAYKNKGVQHRFIYGAMFDEVDEGTAIYKMAPTNDEAPAGTKYEVCTLDEDGYNLPSDWYLRVAGEAQKMLEGSIALSKTMSINPNNPYNKSAFKEHNISMTDTVMIQAEDFDNGGEGLGYHDSDDFNMGGYYRPSESVDIDTIPGGYQVGWIENGEWLEYTVSAEDPGTYDFVFTIAAEMDGITIDVSMDDQSIGTAAVVNTGGETTFGSETKIPGVTFDAGIHEVRLTFSDQMNIDCFELVPQIVNDTTVNDTTVIDTTDTTDTSTFILPPAVPVLRLYPNPVDHILQIDLENDQVVQLHIFDASGRLVKSRATSEKSWDVSCLTSGEYFVNIITKQGITYQKKVLKH